MTEKERRAMERTRYETGIVRCAVDDGRYENDFAMFRKELILSLMVEFDEDPDETSAVVDRAVKSVLKDKVMPTAKSNVPALELRRIVDAALSEANRSDDPRRCYALCSTTNLVLSKPRLFTDKTAAQDVMAMEWAKARRIEIRKEDRDRPPRELMLEMSFDIWTSGNKANRFNTMSAWAYDETNNVSWRIFEMDMSNREDTTTDAAE